MRQGEERYDQFQKSMLPALDLWLEIYEQSLTRGTDKHLVDRVVFGYVNTFELTIPNDGRSDAFPRSAGGR